MMGTVKNAKGDRELTDRQERFAQEYSANGGVAATAAVAAGYSAASAASQGSRLLKNVNVAARIRELHEETAHRLGATRETVVSELAAIAFSSLGNIVTFGPAGIELRPIDEIPRADLAGIADRRARFDHDIRADVGRGRGFRRRINDRGRMNQWVPHPDWCWKGGLGRMKQRRGSCKSQSRLRRNQQRLRRLIRGEFSGNHGACSRFHGRCNVLCVLNKHHVRSRCRLQAGDAFHLGVPAGEIRANLLSQFGELHNL